jgi:hypothetical protein
MMLYKMEYDGPAFPFDLTRTTHLSDVADIIAHDFVGMWDPDSLEYRPEAYSIYHRRWQGLSFAHKVEDDEDPSHDMPPRLCPYATALSSPSRAVSLHAAPR